MTKKGKDDAAIYQLTNKEINDTKGQRVHDLLIAKFDSLGEAVNAPLLERYDKFIFWKTNWATDQKVMKKMREYQDPKKYPYDFVARNCGQVAGWSIQAGGIPFNIRVRPNQAYKANIYGTEGENYGDFHAIALLSEFWVNISGTVVSKTVPRIRE